MSNHEHPQPLVPMDAFVDESMRSAVLTCTQSARAAAPL
jgi:hypothetical protein